MGQVPVPMAGTGHHVFNLSRLNHVLFRVVERNSSYHDYQLELVTGFERHGPSPKRDFEKSKDHGRGLLG
jgi:hypothetical protein